MNRIARTYGPRGLYVLGVNVGTRDTLENARRYVKEFDVPYPSVFDADGEIGRAYWLVGHPYLVLIDRKGIVRHRMFYLKEEQMEGYFEELNR